jgi:2-hydroxycyclohexanecarboxyl-CoA dehydrogenase
VREAGAVAVVTGGAGGIGRAIARRLAAEGYRVAVLDVAEVPERDALGAEGFEVLALHADVSDEGSLRSAKAAVNERWGPVYALVNAAGIFPRFLALEAPVELWQRVLAVNLTGTFLACRTFAPDMRAQGRGRIVTFGSERAILGSVRGAAYAASKGGILALTRSLAREWAPDILVNAVVPGVTDTPMPRLELTEAELEARARAIPLGRIGTPDDVAGVVAFLLSEAAGYVTGQTILVNGGAVML